MHDGFTHVGLSVAKLHAHTDRYAPVQSSVRADSQAYYNSLAVFPFAVNDGALPRMHGHVGVWPNGTQAWQPLPMPPPIKDVNRTAEMKSGGFYLKLANALPMDRAVNDTRDEVCKNIEWDYKLYEDVSIVITFFNEPLSTLLR